MRNFLSKHWLEILVLTCSVLVLLSLSVYHRICDPTLGRDSVNYIRIIQTWHDTGSIEGVLKAQPNFWFPPLSLFLGKLLVDCGIPAESAAVGMNMVFACFLPLIIFGIANEVTENRKIALCSAVLLAFNPVVIDLAVEAQRDMPYLLFCGLLLFFTSCAIRRNRWYYWLAAGGCFSVSFLIRYETLEMIPVFGVYFLLLLIIRKNDRLKQVLHCGIFSITLCAVLFLLLSVSGTTEYVKKQYQTYYEDKYELLQDKTGVFQ